MIREIDPKTHAVIDLRSCTEIAGAVAVDTDTGEVRVLRKTYEGHETTMVRLVHGLRVVRR
jgi:hypothetical protein